MSARSFSLTLRFNNPAQEVYEAIIKPAAWWAGEIEGDAGKAGASFTYRFADMHYSRQQVTEATPFRRVVWHVLESKLNHLQHKEEWTGSDIVFDIAEKEGGTELTFTHAGLQPQWECYESCTQGWTALIATSLQNLVTRGRGDLSVFG